MALVEELELTGILVAVGMEGLGEARVAEEVMARVD